MPELPRSISEKRDTPASATDRMHEALLRLEDYRELVDLGVDLIAQGKPVQAAARLTEALAVHANDAETFTARATAYSILGDLERARADLDRALELHPLFWPALGRRGLVRARIGDPEGALADLDLAIECRPSGRLHFDRGTVRQAIGDPTGASADYSRAIELEPDDPRPWAARGLLRYAAKDLPGAASDLRASLGTSLEVDRALVRRVLSALGQLMREGLLESCEFDALAARHGQAAEVSTISQRKLTISSGTHRPYRARNIRRALVFGTAISAVLVLVLVLWRSSGAESEFVGRNQGARNATIDETRGSVDLEDSIRSAIACVEAGEVPTNPEDATIFSGLDYDDLVAQGVYTREEADLQQALDQALVSRSIRLNSSAEQGESR